MSLLCLLVFNKLSRKELLPLEQQEPGKVLLPQQCYHLSSAQAECSELVDGSVELWKVLLWHWGPQGVCLCHPNTNWVHRRDLLHSLPSCTNRLQIHQEAPFVLPLNLCQQLLHQIEIYLKPWLFRVGGKESWADVCRGYKSRCVSSQSRGWGCASLSPCAQTDRWNPTELMGKEKQNRTTQRDRAQFNTMGCSQPEHTWAQVCDNQKSNTTPQTAFSPQQHVTKPWTVPDRHTDHG